MIIKLKNQRSDPKGDLEPVKKEAIQTAHKLHTTDDTKINTSILLPWGVVGTVVLALKTVSNGV
jgi:hypothetical protein